ncbi:hypothetical protein ACHAXA_004170 [Cyclostephanos tholiformis]|uniref:Uncharacterized protein n=1 Tax=Cyclostephanos tholiformis TaxID=382380 RepID=A0ABD3RBS2_9STRA
MRRRHGPPLWHDVVVVNDENRRPVINNNDVVPDGGISKAALSSIAREGLRPRRMASTVGSERGGSERRAGTGGGTKNDDDASGTRMRDSTRKNDHVGGGGSARPPPGKVLATATSDADPSACIHRALVATTIARSSTTADVDREKVVERRRRMLLRDRRRPSSSILTKDDSSLSMTHSASSAIGIEANASSDNERNDSTTPPTTAVAAHPPASSGMMLLPCLVRLIFVSYEVSRRHGTQFSPSMTAFFVISDLSGWSDVFHAGFVLSVIAGAVATSYSNARGRPRRSSSPITSAIYVALTFLAILSLRMTILPVFEKCAPTEPRAIVNFCPVVPRSSDRWRGGRGIRSTTMYSALDALVVTWYGRASRFARSKIKGRVWREVQRGLFRPFSFHSRVMRLLMLLRWAKFAGPLFGTCNKFRGHVLDMIEKRRQHVRSMAAKGRWNILLDALSRKSKEERAVLNLQRRFREGRDMKARRRLALMSRTGDASNMRLTIRRRLVEEQLDTRVKLRRMEMNEGRRIALRHVSSDDRSNIAEHRRSERTLRKRLLLSPKTSFAVSWKYLTIACAAIEISQFVFAPSLSGDLKKMPLDAFLLGAMEASHRYYPAAHCRGRNGSTSKCRGSRPISVARVVAAVLAPTVNAIVFLDVFVTFFTGELTPAGTLVPKSTVSRWIFPGIGLQLVVNPTMAEISNWVKRGISSAMFVGPSLSYHLFLSCMPLLTCCYDRTLDAIFNFVERQNGILSNDMK